MPARETEAIILKTFPLGEADRLVSFLGRTSGRMRGVAAGARRIKNRYGSTLQVMSHVQLWYVEKETRDLVRIQQCELLESLNKSQSDYGLSTGLAAVSEIVELVLPEHEVSEAMFRLILLTVREIERRASWPLALGYFAFWTVRLSGWLPSFTNCSTCGKAFGKRERLSSRLDAGSGLRRASTFWHEASIARGKGIGGTFHAHESGQIGAWSRVRSAGKGIARGRIQLD